MNLADAIRRAAQVNGAALGRPAPEPVETAKWTAPTPPEAEPEPLGTEPSNLEPTNPAKESHVTEHPHDHNIVRLELVLNPEQLKGFFGAVVASQHSVLTLREAAGYLRVSQSSLEKLAAEGAVPGMLVDGKWRFTRPALEDWLDTRPTKKEA